MSSTKKLYATSTAPFHKEGELLNCADSIAEMMVKNGWATTKEDAPIIKEEKTEVKQTKHSKK